MSGMATMYWTLGGLAAFVLAALWAVGIVRKRRAEAAEEADEEAVGGAEAGEPAD